MIPAVPQRRVKLDVLDRVLCDCGSWVLTKNRYCGFCGNRVEISHTNYIRSET